VSQPEPLSGSAYLRLVALGAVIGIPAAFLAALFLAVVHDLEHWLWDSLPSALGHSAPPWYLVLLLPPAGACVVLLARRLLPGDGGHPPLEGIGGGATPVSHAPGIALAAIGTLSFGAVLGPEAPLIALGSVVGMVVALSGAFGQRERTVLATAGSFSAISALFGGPIVGGMMMVESGVAMGSALLPVLIPGFVAAAIGYVIFVGFGNWGGLETAGLAVPNLPLYDGTRVVDLFFAVVVGVATAIAIAAVTRFAIGEVASRLKSRTMAASLLAGGLAVGLIAILADALGANSQDVLFSGQHSISPLVAETSTGVVVLLLVAKAVAYAVSLVAGFRGGPIFPAVFLGIGIATLPVVWFDVSPTFAVSVGAAAGMAAYGRFVLTAMLFAALLVGSQGFDTIPGAVLAAAAAWLTVTAMDQRLEERSASSPPLPS